MPYQRYEKAGLHRPAPEGRSIGIQLFVCRALDAFYLPALEEKQVTVS